MPTAEVIRPTFKSDFHTLVRWFNNRPNYEKNHHDLPLSDRMGNEQAGIVYANSSNSICSVNIERSPSINHRIFAIDMVLDKSGNPKNLLKSFFFAWATVGERQFLLTYTEKKVLGIDHIAQLTDIQEQKINEKEGNRTDTFEIPKAEKRGIKKQLNQLGYFPVVDYARTAKAAILAKTVESLEIPFKKPKMPAHLQQYTKRVRNLVPGLGRYPSEAEALKIARKKAKEIKDITEKTPFHRRTG